MLISRKRSMIVGRTILEKERNFTDPDVNAVIQRLSLLPGSTSDVHVGREGTVLAARKPSTSWRKT